MPSKRCQQEMNATASVEAPCLMCLIMLCQGFFFLFNFILVYYLYFSYLLFNLQILCIYIMVQLSICKEFLSVWRSGSLCLYLFSWVLSWAFFLLLVLSYSNVWVFVLSYYILFYYLLKDCFLMWYRKEVNLGGKGGREKPRIAEWGETVISIYCVKNVFSIKEKETCTISKHLRRYPTRLQSPGVVVSPLL